REARRMRDQYDARITGVIANRVLTARKVHEALSKEQSCKAVLMTGRARSYDRDTLWSEWGPQIGLERKQEPAIPIFVVATQCIEVGANIDFDALVTEMASLDALEQRFGRLDRNGMKGLTYGAIVAQKEYTAAKYEDAIYGGALGTTWKWLKEHET